MSKHPRKSLLITAAVLLLAGCTGMPAALGQNAGKDLQSKVNSALAKDAELQGQHVTAVVQNGEVTLSGTVQTAQQRQAAETAVAGVPGVIGIADNIQVPGEKPTTSTPAPAASAALAAAPQTAPQTPPPPPPDQTAPPASRAPYQGNAQQPVSGPVTVPAGTLLQIRTVGTLNVTRLQSGVPFDATVASDVYEGDVLAIPRGAVLRGTVVAVQQPGRFGGSGILELQITRLNMGGRTYPLQTDIWSSRGPNKAGYTATNTAGGAILGALLGGLMGRGPGAAFGALVGGGAGLVASGATNGPRSILPPESRLNFHLERAVTVQPVSWQEARRLASNVPRLQRRPVYPQVYVQPYPYYAYPPPPPYAYYGYYGDDDY